MKNPRAERLIAIGMAISDGEMPIMQALWEAYDLGFETGFDKGADEGIKISTRARMDQ
jgi:hypothetical protein